MEDNIYKQILDDLNTKGQFRYRPGSANTSLINARLSEGYTLEDFQIVHDNMIAKWGKDEKMYEYLRPATLYCASKFEGYLNCKPPKKTIEEWR